MTEKTIELRMPLLMPEITDSSDACVAIVETRLQNRKGISRVHVNDDKEQKGDLQI